MRAWVMSWPGATPAVGTAGLTFWPGAGTGWPGFPSGGDHESALS